MPYYSLNELDGQYLEVDGFDPSPITENLFGTQGHYDYDREFGPSSPGYEAYLELLEEMNVSNLRFPGGTTTEQIFTDETFETGNWLRSVAELSEDELLGTRFFLDDLVEVAAEVGASVSIVLPTRVAFTQSAGQAMTSGEYGGRTEIREEYWVALEAFVNDVIDQTRTQGVEIRTFEIGNEFWLGGEMSSTEYGLLAGEIVVWLNEMLENAGVDAQIAVQGIAASATFSASAGAVGEAYLDELEEIENPDYDPDRLEFFLVENGIGINGEIDYRVYETISEIEALGILDYQTINLAHQSSYQDGTSSSVQIINIANGLLSAVNEDGITAGDLVDGMILHPYFGRGFGNGSEGSGIDDENSHSFERIFHNFSETLDRTDLAFHATEWSTRYLNYTDFEGVQSTIEAFFELVSNGVDYANYWPTTFGGTTPTDRVLIQTSYGDLTFPGVTFQMLSESVVGLSALFDYDVHGAIDVHGFGDVHDDEIDRLVVFVGERGGVAQAGVTLDLEQYSIGQDYFTVLTSLGSFEAETTGSSDPIDILLPTLIHSDGRTIINNSGGSNTFGFDLDAFGTIRIELTAITENSDTIDGRDGDDNIEGRGGRDILSGAGGNDVIVGGEGEDEIFGGDGNDVIAGGTQADSVFAGSGNDSVWGDDGRDFIDLGDGNDIFFDNDQNDYYGSDTVDGGNGHDVIYGAGGNDFLLGGTGDDSIFGGLGDDSLFGGSGDDILSGGFGEDVFVFEAGSGNDTIIGFTLGEDLLDISGWGVTSTSELIFSMDGEDSIVNFGSDSLTLDGVDSLGELIEDAFALSGDEVADPSSGGVYLTSYAGDNSLSGNDGNDLLHGGVGSDTMEGGAGNDILIADVSNLFGGADMLRGGTGDDYLEGGAGADTFIFEPDGGSDVIGEIEMDMNALHEAHIVSADFDLRFDRVDLSAFDYDSLATALSKISDVDGMATFSDMGQEVVFYDISAEDLSSAFFIL